MNFFTSFFYFLASAFLVLNIQSHASDSLSYSGRLVNANGSPVTGPVNLKLELAYSGSPLVILCSQDFSNVALTNGVFHLKINFDCGPTLTLSQVLTQVPNNESAAIRVTDVTHSKVYSFQALHSMPFAKIAETSRQLVQMGATDGQVLKWNNTSSKWEPGVPGNTGTVTNVTVSAPLSVINGGSTPLISIAKATSSTDGYLSSTDWTNFNNKVGVPSSGTIAQFLRGDNTWQTLDTSVVPESGAINLYFSNARALGVPLTGFVSGPGVITSTDTILEAFEKTQGQLDFINLENANFLIKNSSDSITGLVTVASPTGFLRLIDPPAIFTDATNMAYVDSRDDLKVSKAGDTMTGDLILNTSVKLKGSTNYVTIKAHATTSNYNFVFPQTAGSNGYVLTTDGIGNTNWVDVAINSNSIVNGSIMDADVNASAAIAQSKIANLTNDLAGKEPVVTNPNDTTKYYRGDKSWQSLNTSAVIEGVNLYFTNARVLDANLIGINTALPGPVVASDSVLEAFGKAQNQISTLNTKGQWERNVNDIYYNSGNVGIGINIPTAKLHVDGVGDTFIRVKNSSISHGMEFGVDSAGDGKVLMQNAKALKLGTNGSNHLTITSAGNIGIGSTSPTTKLEIAGQIKITGGIPGAGKVLTSDASGLATWENSAVGGITSINGLTSLSQTYAIPGTTGTSPSWSSSGSVHTLNIPIASASGVLAGLISKTDYDNFNSKLGTTLSSGNIWVGNGSNVATSVTPTSDVSMNNAGAFTVTKLQGNSISTNAPVLGSFLKWDNVLSQWAPIPLATCSGVNEVMHYVLLTDTWSCDTLNVDNLLPAQATHSGKVLTTNGTTTSWQAPSGITGTGTTNYLPKFTAASTLGDSLIYDNGTKVGVGTNTPVNTLNVFTPYSTASSSGSSANGGFRLMNATDAVVLDMGIGINTTTWLQARDPVNYATKRDLLLNPVGGNVTVGGSNIHVALSTNSYVAANSVLGVVGNNATSASSYGIAVLANNRTTPAVNDIAGELRFSMNNNAGWRDMALINSKADGAGGANGFGGSLILSTKADNINSAPYERMRITSNGNVGINSSTPEGKLVVSGGAGGNYAQSSAASYYPFNSGVPGNAFVEIINTANGYGSPGSFLGLKTNAMSGTPFQRAYIGIAANMGAANYTPNIVIGHQTAATAYQERLRIDASGNIGIGTTTPSAKLDVATGSVTVDAPIFNGTQMWMSGTTTFTAAKMNITDISSAALSKLLDLQVGGVTKFSVDKTGKLTGDGSGLTGITATPAGASGEVQFNNAGSLGASTNLFWDFTNSRLGIGNSTPTNDLDIVKSVMIGGVSVKIQNTSTVSSSQAAIEVKTGAGNAFTQFRNQHGASPYSIITSGSDNTGGMYLDIKASAPLMIRNSSSVERMRVDSNGNVGIGTSSPGTNTMLNVAGQIKSGSASIASGAVDWVSGNSISTSFDCGSSITLANLRDGGSYTLVVTGAGTTQCTFSTTTTGDDANTVTYRFKPANGLRTASSHTVYSLLRIGTIVYVSWISGF